MNNHPMIPLLSVPEGTAVDRLMNEPEVFTPLPLAEIEAAAEKIAATGRTWVLVGRYEPTLHPELDEALLVISSAGLRGKMTTNGRRFADLAVMETLRDNGLAQITVRVFGADAASHDAITGVEGDFGRVTDTLQYASKTNNLRLTVQVPLLKANAEQLGEIADFVANRSDRMEIVPVKGGPDRSEVANAIELAWRGLKKGTVELDVSRFAANPLVPEPSTVPAPVVDRSIIDMIQGDVPVPFAINGLWSMTDAMDPAGLLGAVKKYRGLDETGLLAAAYGFPILDLPQCVGGHGLAVRPFTEPDPEPIAGLRDKVESCAACPFDESCTGLPRMLTNYVGTDGLGPHPTWRPLAAGSDVRVLNPFVSDNMLVLSALPGLTEQLRKRGVNAEMHSIWHPPFYEDWTPYDPSPSSRFVKGTMPDGTRGWVLARDAAHRLTNVKERIAHARQNNAAFIEDLDFTAADAVVVPGFGNAFDVLSNPTLSSTARVMVVDFHLMTGIERWFKEWVTTRSMDGGWWPDERIEVHNLYPRYARTYWRAGIPLKQIRWQAYPFYRGDFPIGPPPAECDVIFSGGNHARNPHLLSTAVDLLPDLAHPICVFSTTPVKRPLVAREQTALAKFYEAIATSRFVILPLNPDLQRPAGISVMTLALAAGRPIISTSIPAALDHLRHGVDSLLIPPDDPGALAKAIHRLDTDQGLLDRLAAGARAAGERIRVDTWARNLVEGGPCTVAAGAVEPDQGPFYHW